MTTMRTDQTEMPWAELATYLNGWMTADQRDAFEARIASDSELRAVLGRTRQALDASASPAVRVDTEQGRAQFWDRIETGSATNTKVRKENTTRRSVPRHRVLSLAGSLVVCLIAFILWKSPEKTRQDAAQRYTVPRGQQHVVRLPDGSRVTLGPDTKLDFTTDNATGARIVSLHGQAFFRIQTNSKRPFIVHSGGVATRVLGTEFSVRKYATDSVTRVAVVSGKVLVQSGSHETVVVAKTAVQVSDSGQVRRISSLAVDEEIAWTHGRLVFRETPITTVAAEVERRYDITIRFADSSFARMRLTASLDTETAVQALDYLALALNARYTRDGQIVTFERTRRTFRNTLRSTPPTRQSFTSEHTYGR
jgi:ferric-dicitrate binding protein FerR (iron transport regulator)